MIVEYQVLYTNQKRKKNKSWQDGYIKYNQESTKITLFNEELVTLDSYFARGKTVAEGEEIETDRFMIQIETRTASIEMLKEQQKAIENVENEPESSKPIAVKSIRSASEMLKLCKKPTEQNSSLTTTKKFKPLLSQKEEKKEKKEKKMLYFPTNSECSINRTEMILPSTFSDCQAYKDSFSKAVLQLVQAEIDKFAKLFYSDPQKKIGLLNRKFSINGKFNDINEKLFDGRKLFLAMERKIDCSKDDLWIIFTNLPKEPYLLCFSTFYGCNSDGLLELIGLAEYSNEINLISQADSVNAVKIGNFSSEIMMLSTLEQFETLKLAPLFVNPKMTWTSQSPVIFESTEKIENMLKQYASAYNLNEFQLNALEGAVKTIVSNDLDSSCYPISLIHGVFGSGKSYLIAVLIIFLTDLMTQLNINRKILISSSTNVAVDRVLGTLIKMKFTKFIRIGSVKKIMSEILPFSIQSQDGSAELNDLKELLKDASISSKEKANIQAAIKKSREVDRKKILNDFMVVGSTCVATAFEIFQNTQFPIVVLDECSQMIEPLSLLPLKFGCEKLIILGDPCQLPPTIPFFNPKKQGIGRTLYDRFVECGVESKMLKIQYRCHSQISKASNVLFYKQQLINGTTDESLESLIPPVTLLNVDGKAVCDKGSYFNSDEAKVIIRLLGILITRGIEPSSIGIISLYKAQVEHLKSKMGEGFEEVQISTIDAFQGAEKELIILSTIKANQGGFIDNPKRINVALTRARRYGAALIEGILLLWETWICYQRILPCGKK